MITTLTFAPRKRGAINGPRQSSQSSGYRFEAHLVWEQARFESSFTVGVRLRVDRANFLYQAGTGLA